MNQFERRWSRFVARQRREQARIESQVLSGLAHQPNCVDCQRKPSASVEPPSPPPPWLQSKRRRRREVQPTWQFCPAEACQYYGWPGLGNLTFNGHPNSSPWRQWHCQACGGYFVETP